MVLKWLWLQTFDILTCNLYIALKPLFYLLTIEITRNAAYSSSMLELFDPPLLIVDCTALLPAASLSSSPKVFNSDNKLSEIGKENLANI